MKNKYLLPMMLLCFACLGIARAEVVTIGSGSGTSQYLPTYSLYNYSLTQQIYTAAEIGRAGTITSIAFKNTGTEKTRTIEIYLVHTNKTSFSSTTDWITVQGSDLVFFGGVTFTAGEWTTIIFDTPFEYNGTSNLAVIVDDETGDWERGMQCAAFNATSMGLRVYSDNTDFNPLSPPTSYADGEFAAIVDVKNQIKLNFSTCLPPTNVHIQEGSLTFNGVTMAWDADGGGPVYQLFMQESEYFDPEDMPWSAPWQFDGSETWNNLDPDTDYTFGLRRYCNQDDQSDPIIMTVHTLPACDLPTNFHVTQLRHDYAYMEWEPVGDFNVEYKMASATEWIPIADHIGSGCGFLNLQPETTYNVRVQRNCPNGYQNNWVETSFTTLATIPFTESFNATSLPNHWQIYSGLLNDVMAGSATLTPATGYWKFGTANGVFGNHAYLNIYNTNRRHWLVTPQVVMQNNCQLSFELALTKYLGTMQPVDPTQQADDRFVVLASTDGGSTWTILREWNNTGSPYVYNSILPTGEDVAIDLTDYEGSDLMIAFYGESTVNGNGDNNLHIDNVSIDYIPPCALPTNVTILETRPHGFTASFTPGSATQTPNWFYYYSTDPNVTYFSWNSWIGSTTFVVDRPDGNYAIEPETTYYLWIMYYCEEENTFVWGDPVTFTTPYACSTKVYARDVEIYDLQAHEVSLDWGDSPATADQWQVCYSQYNIIPPESSMSGNSVIVDEPYATIDGLVPDLDYHFWIRALCDYLNGTPEWGEWSDMITVHTMVACQPPVNVTVSDITSTSAYISWEPVGDNQIEWEVTIESDDWGDPYVAIVDEPFLELDFGEGWLDESEDLPCTVYVSANCGNDDGWSDASETVGFILTDKELLTVNDGTATNDYVPIYGIWVDQYSKSQFIIPADDIVDMQFSEISWMTFYAEEDYIDWGNAEFEVYMMELPCETEFTSTTFYDWNDDMELVRHYGRLSIYNGLMVVDLDEPFFYTDGNLVIGFKQTVSGTYQYCSWYGVNQTGNTAIGGYENSKGIGFQQFLPKISFVYEPSGITVCKKPRDFSVGFVSGNDLRFTWTPGSEDETKWHVAFVTEDDFDPENPTWSAYIVTITHPYMQFDYSIAFEPETTYYFAIRAVCDDDNHFYSDWSCPISITMPDACPLPTDITIKDITPNEATVNWVSENNIRIAMFRVDYDNAYGFETQTLGEWTSVGDGTWHVGVGAGDEELEDPVGAHSGDYNAIITHSESGYETWLISPILDLTGMDDVRLDFWYVNRDWAGDVDKLSVWYRVDGGEWHEMWTTNQAHETWTKQQLTLFNYIGNYQIGFKMTDQYGFGVGLDDIEIIGKKFTGQYDASYPAQSLTLTNLNPNTQYMFYMRVQCDDLYNATDWMSFTTLELPTITQDIDLVEGWNWFSTYIELDDPVALLQMLENGMGGSGVQIESVIDGVDMNAGEEWAGDLMSIGLMNEHTYMIEVTEDVTVELQGPVTDPADHPITIYPNDYSWIGFPCSEEVDVNVALAGFEAEDGDMIETVYGEDGGVIYYYDGVWVGDFDTMIPGRGYIYFSNSDEEKTLIFQTGAHAYVDLGLPSGTLWATCNVGADTPEDYGDFFAWGETTPKDTYNWDTYLYCNCNNEWNNPYLTKYCTNSNYGYNGFTDNLTTLLPEDDAATANWGEDWRMPTKEEWQELYNNTTVTWTQQNGVNGRLFTATNGNSLFLPAAGGSDGNVSIYGYYWSSSLHSVSPHCAWYFYFYSGDYDMEYPSRDNGLSVRPVRSGQN